MLVSGDAALTPSPVTHSLLAPHSSGAVGSVEAMCGLSVRVAPIAIALCLAFAGCGKSLPQATQPPTSDGPPSARGAVSVSTTNTTRLGGSNPVTDAAAVALTAYPGLTRATRPKAVVLVSESNWPAALAASVLAGDPLHVPLLYSEGDTLPEASRRALRDMDPLGTRALGPTATGVPGEQVIQVGATATPPGYSTRVVRGTNAAALAVSIERLSSRLHGHSPHQVIVTAADGSPAMTMPAAGLAAQTSAPILYVDKLGIPRATSAELTRLGHISIYLIGPSTVVSEAVKGQLESFGTVTRIAGATPATNAIAVARFTNGSFGWGALEPGHGFVFANAARPLDAPAAAPLSARGDYAPLLLLESPNRIGSALGGYLSDLKPGTPSSGPVHTVYNHGWLIGDESAISALTQARLDTALEVSSRPAAETEISSTTTPSESTPPTEP